VKPPKVIKFGTAPDAPQQINARWWTLDKEDVAIHVMPLVKQIENKQNYRRVSNLRHARLYSNLEILGLQSGLYAKAANDTILSNRVTLNVIKSCVDTSASKIAKAKPRPLFLTDGGDWSMQKKAKNLTKFMDAKLDDIGLYEQMQRGFLDCAIFGTGAVKFFAEDGEIKCERILIDEIIVDDSEGMYGTTQTLYQSKFIDKAVLKEMFATGKDADKIANAIDGAKTGVAGDLQSPGSSELVRVIEGWHLPTSKKSKDGKHCICIENMTLVCEPWNKQYFPFVFQRWAPKITGFWGMGLAEELTGIQLEINKLLRAVQIAQRMMAVPRVFIESNSMVNSQHINNDPEGSIVKYTGQPPIFNTSPAMPAEIYQHIESLYRKAYEITGISQLAAQSKKPSGLNSAVALREFQDIESDRFQLCGMRYEQAHLEAAKIIIDMTKDLANGGTEVLVRAKDGRSIVEINWSDVDLKEDEYVMRVFPTSILPTTPAGKLQTVQELTQAGFIDKDMAMSLLDFPDLDGYKSLQLAATQDVKRIIEKILEEGEYETPEPYMNLQLAVTMTQSAYLQARQIKTPESHLELLRQFIDDCQALIIQAQAPQPGAVPPGMPPDGMPPQAAPQAPPVSELLPNGGAA
jgi:hypothetical protein